jgi:hypothetical protein
VNGAISSGYSKADVIDYLSARPNFAQNPPQVPRPVPQELQPGNVMTNQGPMSYQQATAAGPNQPAGQAEQAMGFGQPAGDTLKTAAKTNALAGTYAAQSLVAPETLLGRMLLQGGASAAQSGLQGGSPKDAAISGALGAGTQGLIEGAGRVLPAFLSQFIPAPFKASGGAALNEASQIAGKNAVAVEGAGQAALSAQEMQQAGRTMPRVMQRFLQRVTAPNAAPLTYDEARQFESAAGDLSANENAALASGMRRQLNQFRGQLRQAIQQTADDAGVGQQYSQGITDYATAKRLEERWQTVWSFAKKAAITSALGVAGGAAAHKGYQLYSDLTEK